MRNGDGRWPSSQGPIQIMQQGGMPEEVAMIDSTPPHAIKPTIYGGSASASANSNSAQTTKPWSPIKGRIMDWADL